MTYIVIGDGTASGSGNIEAIVPLTGQTIPADGIFLAAEDTLTLPATPDLVLNGATNELNFENSDNVTHMLVAGFIGQLNDDVDANDDCVMDNMPWAAVLDQIALVEVDPPVPGVDDCLYGTAKIGPDGTFVPGHEFRCPDGTGAFLIGLFDPPGADDTPGTANICVARPVPSSGQKTDVRASRQVSPQEARERSKADD